MGLTSLNVDIANPASPHDARTLEFLIDSGAIESVVPAQVLDELGIKPIAEQQYRLANGDSIARRKGIAQFRYGERVGGANVIFGEPGDHNLLGVLTLEALGLALDPLKRELLPLPLILA